MRDPQLRWPTWALIAGYLIWVLVNAIFHSASNGVSAAVNVIFMIAIATIHGLRRYSWSTYLTFFAITFIVSNFYENLSISIGFPFGHYHYTSALGTKLLLVPIIIAPAYFGVGYLAWTLSHVLVGVFERKLRGSDVFVVPCIASFVMVMWDIVMDPISSTVQKQWIWHGGGSYFGVPLSNYAGWLICVYTIFQLFALYLARRSDSLERIDPFDPAIRQYWYQATASFVIVALTWSSYAITGGEMILSDATGKRWDASQLYESMALVAIFTMFFVALLSTFLIMGRNPESIGSSMLDQPERPMAGSAR